MSEDEDKVWKIKELKGFCEKCLQISCDQIGISKKEYDDYINTDNVEQIVKTHAEHEDEELYINDEILELICDDIQNWVLGVQISKMCSSGKLDCYWDNKKNCMVFKVAKKEKEGD